MPLCLISCCFFWLLAGESGAAAADQGDGSSEDCGRDEGGRNSLHGQVLFLSRLLVHTFVCLLYVLFHSSVLFQVSYMLD